VLLLVDNVSFSSIYLFTCILCSGEGWFDSMVEFVKGVVFFVGLVIPLGFVWE
jgi:hypothetical protein